MWLGLSQYTEGLARTKWWRKGEFTLSAGWDAHLLHTWTSALLVGRLSDRDGTVPQSSWACSLQTRIVGLHSRMSQFLLSISSYVSLCPSGSISLKNPNNFPANFKRTQDTKQEPTGPDHALCTVPGSTSSWAGGHHA